MRTALAANALFSTLTGFALLADLGGIAFELQVPRLVTALVGGGLLLFAVLVGLESRRLRPVNVLAITGADLAWVAASVVGVLLHPHGVGWVLGSAAIVAALAVAQLVGLKHALREVRPGLGAWRYAVSVDAHASPAAMWRVVRDVGSISQFMPELATSEMRGGAAACEGAVRLCSDRGGASWAEEITRFDDAERAFDVRFVHEAPGFPFPARVMFGGWRVAARDTGSRVEVWWSLTPAVHRVPWLAVALMGVRVDRSIARAVARMDAAGPDANAGAAEERCSAAC